MARRVASLYRERLLGLAASFIAVVASSMLMAAPAAAYPWMVRHGYTTCNACHLDPSGAGLMTPYGRAQSEVFLRTQYGQSEGEDSAALAEFAFGAVALPEELLLQADVRGTWLRVMPPKPAPAVSRFILMQADWAAGLLVDRFFASVSLGYVHEGALGASVTHGDTHRLVSRQHWAGFAFGADGQFLVRAGRLNVPYGLRVIEHTLWIKSETRTDINAAQQHGVALFYGTETWRAELLGIVGNLQLAPAELRERGYSAYVERALGTTAAVGVSSLVTHAAYELSSRKPVFRQAHGVFGRVSPVEPLVVMTEVDLLVRSPKNERIEVGATGMLQLDLEPVRGLHLIGTGELLNPELGREPSLSYGGWLSLNWFALPHLDVRVDLIRQNLPVLESRTTVTSMLGQVHGFL
jgi:hypothetical protein